MNVIMDEAPCWPGSGRMVYAALRTVRSLPAVMHNHAPPLPGVGKRGKKNITSSDCCLLFVTPTPSPISKLIRNLCLVSRFIILTIVYN